MATAAKAWETFHQLHEARFGFAIPREVIEVITFKCTAVSAVESPQLPTLPASSGAATSTGQRQVVFEDGTVAADVYRRDDLADGDTLTGPALVEEAASVTVLKPGQTLRVDRHGNLIITSD